MGLLGSAFPLSYSKTQGLLDQLLGIEMSRGAIAAIRERSSATLEQHMQEALVFARHQPVAYVDETGAPTDNADGNNPTGKRGWQWVMVTAVVTVFIQGLSRSTRSDFDPGKDATNQGKHGLSLAAAAELSWEAAPPSARKDDACPVSTT